METRKSKPRFAADFHLIVGNRMTFSERDFVQKTILQHAASQRRALELGRTRPLNGGVMRIWGRPEAILNYEYTVGVLLENYCRMMAWLVNLERCLKRHPRKTETARFNFH